MIYNMPYFLIKMISETSKSCGVYCAAINYHNARRNCKLSMFQFPKDEESGDKIIDKMI